VVDSDKVKCQCGKELDSSHTGPCPNCGKTDRKLIKVVNEPEEIKEHDWANLIRESWEEINKRKKDIIVAITIDIAIVLVATTAGYFCGDHDIIGALIGSLISILLISVINLLFRRKVKTKTTTITKFS